MKNMKIHSEELSWISSPGYVRPYVSLTQALVKPHSKYILTLFKPHLSLIETYSKPYLNHI